MARKGARTKQELPPPLPPETRTIGQVVAEALNLYRRRFWPSLALGLPVALIDTTLPEFNRTGQIVYACTAGALLITAAYVGGCMIVSETRPSRRDVLVAYGLGIAIFLPFPVLAIALILPAAAWLALVGMAVPAALFEHLGPRKALRRGIRLGRVDYVHALGSLATLGIAYFLTRLVLLVLLHGASESGARTAAFLADLVISPVLFLGAALLYFDQAARVESGRPRARRSDADLHHALEPDGAGRADAEGQP
jgi:hypothetical protein